jgi:predicted site-specific integrase-resolvase
MTKGEMCEALGVTLKTYNSYIRDGMIPSDVLEKLHAITGKSVDYLLGLREQEQTA